MITRWLFILIYGQIRPLVSEEKIFKDMHYNMHYNRKNWRSKFVLAILVEGH